MNSLKKLPLVSAIAVLAVLSSTGVLAGETPHHSSTPFATFDKNGDGWVSKKEFSEMRSRMLSKSKAPDATKVPKFSDFDKNGDGKLSPSEFSAGH